MLALLFWDLGLLHAMCYVWISHDLALLVLEIVEFSSV